MTETGVPFMNEEHALLLDMYQRLAVCLLGNGDVEAFASSFENLLEFAAEHFAHEEAVMRECRYPAFLEHRQAHAKLLEAGTNLLHTVWERFEEYDCYALLLFIRHWLTSHIRNHDEPFAAFLLELEGEASLRVNAVVQPASTVTVPA